MMGRTERDIYRDAIKWLWENSFRKTEHAEDRTVELFNKLLARHHSIHTDEVRELCRATGYDSGSADEVTMVYDYLDQWYQSQASGNEYWTAKMIEQIENGDVPTWSN